MEVWLIQQLMMVFTLDTSQTSLKTGGIQWNVKLSTKEQHLQSTDLSAPLTLTFLNPLSLSMIKFI